jgi:hypothetical protein
VVKVVMDLVQANETGSKGKKISRKWSEEEVAALAASIARVCGPNESTSSSMNWAEIAKAVPGRTGKQCREKYKVGQNLDWVKSSRKGSPWTSSWLIA